MRVLGLTSSLCSGEEKEEEITGDGTLTPVYLNVYDLTPVNNYLYWFGLGIFHSGIEGKCSFFSLHSSSFLLFLACVFIALYLLSSISGLTKTYKSC